MFSGQPSFHHNLMLGKRPRLLYNTSQGLRQNRMHIHRDGVLFHKHAGWQTKHLHTIVLANRHTLTLAYIGSTALQRPGHHLCPNAEYQAKIVIGLVLLSFRYFDFSEA